MIAELTISGDQIIQIASLVLSGFTLWLIFR
jgi:hypothetical protein